LVTENQNLNELVARAKLQKLEEPDEVLKRKLNNADKELQGKDYQICSLKEKVCVFFIEPSIQICFKPIILSFSWKYWKEC
jgi:hypothetical protein